MKSKWVIGCALLFVLLLAAVIVVLRQAKPAAAPALPITSSDPERFVANDVELALQDIKGEIRWKLQIAKIEERKSGTDLFKITGWYYPQKEAEPLRLTAKTGQINPDMNRLVLQSGVRLERSGFILQGGILNWDAEDGILRLTEGVTVTSRNYEGRGNTLSSDARLEKFRFEGENVWRVLAPLHKEGEQ
ncbi:MAG TPA: LPS export ABC transporter periplasmic protein LptC [Firmicutes bacterium]|jgi:hypothetical protein|nr:LPS export ABC transporter periplasmic protein LptC [Bacillota bacterium]HOQ23162.1 LPS export ABC transporter periplasmic protein LptC [Bacillota bacterium]HPT66591.1 LPS export ABC transporter periplasmic protein LptC [Bacillota bacterium]